MDLLCQPLCPLFLSFTESVITEAQVPEALLDPLSVAIVPVDALERSRRLHKLRN